MTIGAALAASAAVGGERAADAAPAQNDDLLRLWYDAPARDWVQALPIGNGRLGAMVFGGTATERLQLNENSLWAGGPHDYDSPEALAALPEIRRLVFAGEWKQAQDLVNEKFMGRPVKQSPYQTVGSLLLAFPGQEGATNYRRELDLEDAITRVTFTDARGVRYTREAFASYPDQVIVMRLTADRPGSVSFTATYDTPLPVAAPSMDGGNTLRLDGHGTEGGGSPGRVRFRSLARLQTEGGTVTPAADGRGLIVSGANAVTLLLSIATSYTNWQDVSGDAAARADAPLRTASAKSYEELKRAHLADYRPLFRRVRLDLGTTEAAKRPTDQRITTFKDGGDPQLAALHFQFGRYLLIACSRPGSTQPATLQGLWNDQLDPPWGSKFTININTEMNYWPAAPSNLMECYAPLFRLIADLSVAGQRTAKTHYGARGWVTHHNADAWRGTAPVDGSLWGMWPMGGAWLCKSLWDHYEFSGDRAALREHYPLLKGAAEFFLDALVEEPTHKWLVTCPSISPENSHHPGVSICAGPAMDSQILRDLFGAVAQASEVLKVDAEFRARVGAARARLAPDQVGRAGHLQEWLHDWDEKAPEQHHRHVSHLYALYPGAQITRRKTPELFAAARNSLERRGDMATGWSLAWKINLWARLEDGNRAYELLRGLLTPERTAPNLFDLHPPFQIDGNFGATSGLCEMLLQSHAGELHFLPALPSAWPSGSVTGLRARGGFVVDLAWRGGKLTGAKVLSKNGTPCAVRYKNQTAAFKVEAGAVYTLDGSLASRPTT
jgi:alpha-L-fucosidase 2